jgi:hypothetical protein
VAADGVSVLCGVATRGVSLGCRFAWGSLRASKSAKARIDSSCTCGVQKHKSKGAEKLQGLDWKEVSTVICLYLQLE